MGLVDKFAGQFVDIVEWLDSTDDTIVYRFQRYNNEIKMGANWKANNCCPFNLDSIWIDVQLT